MDNTYESFLEARLQEEVLRVPSDAAHDIGHLSRVWRTCRKIVQLDHTEVDIQVLMASAYLHDVVHIPKGSNQRSKASALSAKVAVEILTRLNFPEKKLPDVAHAIEAHSFSAGIETRSTEAKILQDSDRLEALGAIGIARAFAVGGSLGSQLFHSSDPLACARDLDDGKYILDHFFVKLRKLPELMNTPGGKTIAEDRLAFMETFVDELVAEMNV
ncbi:HD domain-containing protein [Methylobacterium mesophilicum]|uniref:HD domain-containing protein n=1 Tax=Methylobacterium mesophilicum TaxID=39956 RepID=UPI002F35A8D4